MEEPLASVERRFEEIEAQMGRPEVAADYSRLEALTRQRATLEGTVTRFRKYRVLRADIEGAREVLRTSTDEEFRALAQDEVDALEPALAALEAELRLALLPKDPRDDRDVIVEVRAGTGGDEAALFAGDLFRMYVRYAQLHGWGTEILSSNETGIGGFKEIIFNVRGTAAYARLKHESGVHRVQRVPTTEASGRIHTSTATVAVLPEADEVEVEVKSEDVRVDVFHAGGAGGQNVNKVATAIRLTHVPSGIVVVCQDERSQLQNRVKAYTILRSRLLDAEIRRQQEDLAATRRSQVGTGERSEKIRTYNFPQNRVSDHRINLTVHSLDRLMDGDLDAVLDALTTAEQERLMAESVLA
ncbi:MAG: peptide chain release factor 1 [Chloroflexi bacterium]|nr:peptide chain release factor 1 [Chloroflexota bacterium]